GGGSISIACCMAETVGVACASTLSSPGSAVGWTLSGGVCGSVCAGAESGGCVAARVGSAGVSVDAVAQAASSSPARRVTITMRMRYPLSALSTSLTSLGLNAITDKGLFGRMLFESVDKPRQQGLSAEAGEQREDGYQRQIVTLPGQRIEQQLDQSQCQPGEYPGARGRSPAQRGDHPHRSEEHTAELQSRE